MAGVLKQIDLKFQEYRDYQLKVIALETELIQMLKAMPNQEYEDSEGCQYRIDQYGEAIEWFLPNKAPKYEKTKEV